jgi:ATP/ADP translocase
LKVTALRTTVLARQNKSPITTSGTIAAHERINHDVLQTTIHAPSAEEFKRKAEQKEKLHFHSAYAILVSSQCSLFTATEMFESSDFERRLLRRH